MNIYITPENEKLLRQEESMSGLINRLIASHYADKRIKKVVENPGTAAERERYINEEPKESFDLLPDGPEYLPGGREPSEPNLPKTAPDQAPDNFTGPIYRNSKKGKL